LPILSRLTPESAAKLIVAAAVAGFSTAGAAAGTATVITGSASPAVWISAYGHARECSLPSAGQDPACSPDAVRAAAEQQLADTLEARAKLAAGQAAPAPAVAPEPAAPTSAVASAPAAPARHPSDDSGEPRDD
jgi:hypothetical protein